jgi:hypothetical protein
MEWLDAFRSHAVALPNLAKFAIVIVIIAGAPATCTPHTSAMQGKDGVRDNDNRSDAFVGKT